MAEYGGWEKIKQLGKGGQSQVFLARSPARVEERQKYLDAIKQLSGQGFNDARAQRFTEATFGYGRNEHISELGALKIYAPRAAGVEAEKHALARLKIEIAVLGEKRRGLPRLLASDESERWIVTEFFSQGTLEQHLLRFQGKPLHCLAAFHTLVQTVSQLHKDGVVHRDIKPANVFIGNDENLILGDFGIAFLPNLPERLTFTNESVGPRDYMPPWAETEERLEAVTTQFDVYMLGKLLWCTIAGRLKLPREWHRRPEFDLNSKFPNDPHISAINKILDKCLHDDQSKLFPSALELLEAVEYHLTIMKRGGQMLTEGTPRPCRVWERALSGFQRCSW
jgi:serine/threonine protein kinase